MSLALLNEAWRLHRAGDYAGARTLYHRCLDAEPENFDVLFRLGFLHGQCGQFQEAEHFLALAVRVDPRAADAHFMHGYVLSRLRRIEDAVFCYGEALRANAGLAEALVNRAALLFRLRRYREAAGDYDRLLTLDPDFPYARGNRLFCRLWCCDWRGLAAERAAIGEGVRTGKRIIAPFDGKVVLPSAQDDLAVARLWLADAPAPPPLWQGEIYAHPKIRVAYCSANFRAHPVAAALAGVIAAHDRARFEIFAISFGSDDASPSRRALQMSCDHFLDVAAQSESEIAAVLRRNEIDIAVDLMGFSEECRPGIFALRPAPVQVNYLGYPGTMGAASMDYIIADRVVIPEAHMSAYAERIVTLPDSFMPTDSRRAVADAPSRSQAGLPEQGFVFAALHAAYKITPEMFDIWMRLLHAVEGSVLWLAAANEEARANLAAEAAARGIDPARLVFAPYLASPGDHLARLRLAGLFLDAFPYNAHATGTDALWAGVPVVTMPGESFASRVGASLLHAAGLPELVAETPAAYEALALRLARDADALAEIKAKLARARDGAPLFDTARYARALEQAFTTMHTRQRAGEPPQNLVIPVKPF